VDSCMQATLADMSVQSAAIVIFFEKFPEIAQISADFVRRNGGVLPALPCLILSGNAGRCAKARLANLPDDMFFLPLVIEFHRWNDLWKTEIVHQPPRFGIGFLFGFAAKFD